MDGWMMDWWMDGWMDDDVWMDGWMEVFSEHFCSSNHLWWSQLIWLVWNRRKGSCNNSIYFSCISSNSFCWLGALIPLHHAVGPSVRESGGLCSLPHDWDHALVHSHLTSTQTAIKSSERKARAGRHLTTRPHELKHPTSSKLFLIVFSHQDRSWTTTG